MGRVGYEVWSGRVGLGLVWKGMVGYRVWSGRVGLGTGCGLEGYEG